jgi:hypothetical protein
MNRGRVHDLFPVLLLPTLAERAVSAPGIEALGGAGSRNRRGSMMLPRARATTGRSARCSGASHRLGGLPDGGRPASAWNILQRVV